MTDFLTDRKAILDAGFVTKEIEVPAWGGTVLVRELTADEVEQIGFGMTGEDGKVDPSKARGRMPWIVARCVIDEKHERIFVDGDARRLAQRGGNAIIEIATAVLEMSGLIDEEEASKN